MWWLKVIVSALVIINFGSGNPLLSDEELHNVEELKFKKFSANEQITPFLEPVTYRLPNTSIPLNYDITLTTNIHIGLFDFTGHVKIHVQVKEVTQEIVLHYRQTEIDSVNLLSTNSQLIASELQFVKIPNYEFLVITLPRSYTINEEFILEISYHGRIRDDGGGFYYGNYTNENGQLVFYATTQFEVTDARHAMPCYDEPGIRAPMDLTIIHGKKYSAVANMDVVSTQTFGDLTITKFKTMPSIQTYLLAFLISDFDFKDATNTRVPQKIYAKPAAIADGEGDYAASIVGTVLAKLEEVLEFNYPNDKMDHAALNYFNFGAMENFGLITYIDSGLLLDPTISENQKFVRENSIVGLISHEYAHQFFGNVVSPKWWTYTWLNEGFATLFASYIPHLIYPDRNIMARGYVSNINRAFSNDVNGSWSMNHYTEEPNELWSKFGAIGYQKSGCVLRMFMEVLTEPVFLKGLSYYLHQNNMTAATPDELHTSLQAAYLEYLPTGSLNIGELMYTWENQPGFPIITVSVSGSNLQFSQRRYPSSNGEIYSVPLTITTKTSHNFNDKTPKRWLLSQSASFTQTELDFNATNNDWIILNTQQVGYYRVDYESSLWLAIIEQLTTNPKEIHSINRAVLQDEIYLAWTELGRVTAEHVLQALSYFADEDDSITWSKAQTTFNVLNNRLFGTSAYEKFLEMIVNITTGHLEKIGYNGIDPEDAEITSLRSFTKPWNCLALDDKCLVLDYNLFYSYYVDGNRPVTFDYCNAIRLMSETRFTEILNNVLNNRDFENRSNFLANFGCSMSSENLSKFLGSILNSTNNLNAGERALILSNTFSRSPLALTTTLQFIDENSAALNGIISTSFYSILTSMASYINGQPNTAAFQGILPKLNSTITADQITMLSSIVASNNAWISNHYTNVLNFFGLEETTIAPTTTTTQSSSSSSSVTSTTQSTTSTTDNASSIFLSTFIFLFCGIMTLIINNV